MTRNLINGSMGFLVFLLITSMFSSCASLTGYQDGRSIGEGNGEVNVSFNLSQSPDFNDLEDSLIVDDVPTLRYPNIEIGGKYGVTERLDVTFRLNTNLNLGVGAKYQVVGDRTSPFALGLGAEAGTFGLVSGLWNVQIPLYASFHPTQRFTIYGTPRYIYQFTSIGGTEGWNYLGGNFGILFGNRHKFGIDFGYYEVRALNVEKVSITTIGIGGRFRIGNNEPAGSSGIRTTKKRKVLR